MRHVAHIAVCLCLVVGFLLAPTGPAIVHAQRREAISVIAHPSAGVVRLDRSTLAAIFALSMRNWDNGRPIVPFNYPPRHELRVAFDHAVLSMSPDEMALFWISQRVRGRGSPPRAASTPQLMLKVIENLKGAIGYVPATFRSQRVVVVATISPEGRITEGAGP